VVEFRLVFPVFLDISPRFRANYQLKFLRAEIYGKKSAFTLHPQTETHRRTCIVAQAPARHGLSGFHVLREQSRWLGLKHGLCMVQSSLPFSAQFIRSQQASEFDKSKPNSINAWRTWRKRRRRGRRNHSAHDILCEHVFWIVLIAIFYIHVLRVTERNNISAFRVHYPCFSDFSIDLMKIKTRKPLVAEKIPWKSGLECAARIFHPISPEFRAIRNPRLQIRILKRRSFIVWLQIHLIFPW